jgi:peptidoglycan/xylan/chitin deacetylase (PgdA/CDA1 family)
LTRARSAAWLARTRGRPDTRGLRVLFYHRVSDDSDELAVRVVAFRRQMELLARDGWRVVDVVELGALLDRGEDTGRVVGLSFDDAYLDVAEHAEPVLVEHGFHATVFVATGVTDGRGRFAWYAEQPPLIGWDAMRELDGRALRFEPHTVTHPNLLTLHDAAVRNEIAGSKEELEQRLGRATSAFCYPAGLFGEREQRVARDAGFAVAVSCEPGVNRRDTDRFALRRIQIDARDGLLDFRAKLGGGHDSPLPLRAAWRRVRYGMGGDQLRERALSRRG